MRFVCRKIGCSALFDEGGNRVMVTLLSHEESVVLSVDSGSFSSRVVVGFRSASGSRLKKPQLSLCKNSPLNDISGIASFDVLSGSEPEPLSIVELSGFEVGGLVDVMSISMGKGFSGVMKRHGFSGLRASHGVSISHRSHGSTGQCQDPGKVFKGKKMAGRKGGKRITVKNLRIAYISEGVIAVGGTVPGPKNGRVVLQKAIGWRGRNAG